MSTPASIAVTLLTFLLLQRLRCAFSAIAPALPDACTSSPRSFYFLVLLLPSTNPLISPFFILLPVSQRVPTAHHLRGAAAAVKARYLVGLTGSARCALAWSNAHNPSLLRCMPSSLAAPEIRAPSALPLCAPETLSDVAVRHSLLSPCP